MQGVGGTTKAEVEKLAPNLLKTWPGRVLIIPILSPNVAIALARPMLSPMRFTEVGILRRCGYFVHRAARPGRESRGATQ